MPSATLKFALPALPAVLNAHNSLAYSYQTKGRMIGILAKQMKSSVFEFQGNSPTLTLKP